MGPYAPQDLANLTQGCLGPLKWETVEVSRTAYKSTPYFNL